jgi:cytochrome c peroxidase
MPHVTRTSTTPLTRIASIAQRAALTLLAVHPITIAILGASTVAGPWAFYAHNAESTRVPNALPSFRDAEVKLGDRLFFETRFAHFFYTNSQGTVNAPLVVGDPVVENMATTRRDPFAGSLRSPFRGQSMNCRQCHIGDDFIPADPFAGRTYTDFGRRSPVPQRRDDQTETVRNSPLLVGLGLTRQAPALFHFDGEFATIEDLVVDTLTGRNFGWLPSERSVAVSHVANVLREDQGVNPRQLVYGGGRGIPYSVVLRGTAPDIPAALKLPAEYRLDVRSASAEQLLRTAAKLVTAYVHSLRFGTLGTLRLSRSPYDVFLDKNGLPNAPEGGESDATYAQRLLAAVNLREDMSWVTNADDQFALHAQEYEFGPAEFRGMKVFLRRSGESHRGNCVACHVPPQFTDYKLRNTGVSQSEYDSVFGLGAFSSLSLPDLATRNSLPNEYLPATPAHPYASNRFRAAPRKDRPGYADLGAWNIFANPDFPGPQEALTKLLCESSGLGTGCTVEALLPFAVALFKTPSIRDLGQSQPYFHTGAADTIEDAIRFYVEKSAMARMGKIRNASVELAAIRIDLTDVQPLAAFLRALNEDYR